MKVKIITESHEHEGKLCKVGDVLDVDQDRAEWLREHGVAEPLNPAKSKNADEEKGK
jgi:hypothetical protein